MITSYYTTKLGLEPETIAYKDRVEADGGEVIDLSYVDSVYKKLKSMNLLQYLQHYTLDKGGIKKDENGNVSKKYSLVNDIHDGVQNIASKQPTYLSDGTTYNGDADDLFLGTVQAGNGLALGGGVGTVEVRIKPFSGARDIAMRIVDKSSGGNGANGYGLGVELNGGMYLFSSGINTFTNIGLLEDDIFNKVTGVFNGSNSKIYKNSVFNINVSVPLVPNVTTEMRIGTWNHSTGREFKGVIDYVRIFSKVLTQEEITELNAL